MPADQIQPFLSKKDIEVYVLAKVRELFHEDAGLNTRFIKDLQMDSDLLRVFILSTMNDLRSTGLKVRGSSKKILPKVKTVQNLVDELAKATGLT